MALTGGRVSGIETLATGISTHFTAANTIPNLMQDLCHKGITALDDLQSVAKPEVEQLAVIDRCFAIDDVDQILCTLLAEEDAWAQEQAKIIQQKCPMTVKVALKQLRMGAVAQNFAQWMAMEYRIGSRMCRRPDFREGVRAVQVIKIQNPSWSPAHLSQINDQDVQAMFEPLVDELELLPEIAEPMSNHIWVRAEQRALEQRVPITPTGVTSLLQEGWTVTVERSAARAIPDEAYEKTGCVMVEANSWHAQAPNDAIILGLKELDPNGPDPEHRHICLVMPLRGRRMVRRCWHASRVAKAPC